jgi:hypothetical protein
LVFESNWDQGNNSSDHHYLWNEVAGNDYWIMRGNVFISRGGYGFPRNSGASIGHSLYNDTFFRPNNSYSTASFGGAGNDVYNNLYTYAVNETYGPIYAEGTGSGLSGGWATQDYNLAYHSGAFTRSFFGGVSGGAHSLVGNQAQLQPTFADEASFRLWPQSNSPQVNIGGPLTTTVGAGSGTVVTVANAKYFMDGRGVTEGDSIKIGSNAPAKIISINYAANTITLDRSMTWSNGNGVYWRNSDGLPDVGAYEYLPGGYTIAPSLNYDGGSNVATVSVNSEIVRFVEFWIDGRPAPGNYVDYTAPFQYNLAASGLSNGSQHVVKVVARPLYASPVLGYEDSLNITIGTSGGSPIVNPPPPTPSTTSSADFNRDGSVNSVDFSLLASAWNTNNSTYDLTADGLVNSLDFAIMARQWTL